MKIAQIAPLVESVPPTLYGGTERVVSWLTEELVRQGHEVTLFASGDSRTAARLVPIVPRALRLTGIHNSTTYNIIMLDRVATMMEQFDVMHFHIDFFHYPLFRRLAHKTLTTLHGRQDLPGLADVYRAFPHMPLVSISDHQRKPLPLVNWLGTVYHGMPENLLSEGTGEGGYLANYLLEVFLEDGARFERIVVADDAPEGVLVSTAEVHLTAGASFGQTVLTSGARRQRLETRVL